MNVKSIVLIILLLVLAQVLMFNYVQKENIGKIDGALARYKAQKMNLTTDKSRLLKRAQQIKGVVETIPPWLLTGFEDPEVGFVEFLDYLKGADAFKMKNDMQVDRRTFMNRPIPLHASDFTFKFTFGSTYNAEKFLNYLIFQERFPLKVKGFSIIRGPERTVDAKLTVTLLIPARLDLKSRAASK